jgi:hypothetical protein
VRLAVRGAAGATGETFFAGSRFAKRPRACGGSPVLSAPSEPVKTPEPIRQGGPAERPAPVQPGTAARSLIWAIAALPTWTVLSLVPAALVGEQPGAVVGWALVGGMFLAAALVALLDRRIAQPVPPLPSTFRAPAGWMWPSAWLAGCGATILASELGNVALSLLAGAVMPAGESGGPAPVIPAWQLGLVWGGLHPWGFVLVLCAITHRRLAAFGRPRRAFWGAVGMGAVTLPGPLPQVVGLVAFPVWVYRWTRSVGVALVSFLPSALVYVLGVAGVKPGIDGFDVISAEQVLFQPVWFDLVGAILLAVGVFPFLRIYGTDAPKAGARA